MAYAEEANKNVTKVTREVCEPSIDLNGKRPAALYTFWKLN